MKPDFDRIIDRRSSESIKWRLYPEDVLPLWIADMDFEAPPAVVEAIRKRAEHGIYGYPHFDAAELKETIVWRMRELHNWEIRTEDVLLVPGVVTGFNWVSHAIGQPGDEILVQTPAYPPLLAAPGNAGRARVDLELTRLPGGAYAIDFDRFAAGVTDKTSLFLLCNPQNPTGRVFTRAELERMAEICLSRGVTICSDEIHCDLVYRGNRHIPIASLDPEIARNTITLIAPSKTYNIAGLECSFAIVQNKELRAKLDAAQQGLVGWVNLFGMAAGLAAYRDGQAWLDELLLYLESNRDFLYQFVQERLPGIEMAKPEGTYLAWLNCRQARLDPDPYHFFLKQAKVGLNDGRAFGPSGAGFIRLNFASPRSLLCDALERMAAALEQFTRSDLERRE